MSRKKFELSMNDTTELKQMILANPELPLLIFAGEEAHNDDYGYSQADVRSVEIQELTLHGDEWVDKEDLTDKLMYDCCDFEEYADMTIGEYEDAINDKVKSTEFVKAIVIYVG